MSKIAFVSGWYGFDNQTGINENNRFILQCLFDSAKKNFLPNHDVDIIFMSNNDIKFDNVINVNFDYTVGTFWHMCLMKILSLRYLEDKYDYIFVADTDQIFTKIVNDDDVLNDDIIIVNHFFNPHIEGIHIENTDPNIIPLHCDTMANKWTMGNFFGGKRETMMKLLEFTEFWHNQYHGIQFLDRAINFYTRYPEEYFLIKFIYENNISHKRLTTTVLPMNNELDYFLSDFQDKEEIYPDLVSVKLLHNTKKSVETLEKIIKYYI